MTIVFLVNALQSGGAEKQMLWMATTLQLAGHSCSVIELRSLPGNKRLGLLVKGAETAGVKIKRASVHMPHLTSVLRVLWLLCRSPGTVVWSWGYRADSIILVSRLLGAVGPWLCSLRTVNAKTLSSRRWAVSLFTVFGAQYVTNTRLARELLTKIVPSTARSATTIYNFVEGIEDPPLELPEKCPVPLRVMMLGNIDLERKGYGVAIEAAEVLKSSGLRVEIHIAGREDPLRKLQAEILRRGLEGIVKYHGEADAPLDFLRSGHCFLLTSPYEGMPNALLEAACLGLPIISTRVGDLGLIARDRKEIIFVERADAQAVKMAVEEILDDWPGARIAGRNAREWCVKFFSPAVVGGDLLRLVSEIEVLAKREA